MKWISLSIPLLLCATTLAQSKTEKEEYIDSLQKVVNTTTSDSIRIETYYVWDELIYIEDPDLDFEINEKVAAIAEKNIKSADLSKQQKDYFKACKAKSTNIMGLVLVEYGDYKTAHDLFQESLNIGISTSDTAAMASAFNNLGMIYKLQESPEISLQYYERAMAMDGNTNEASKAIYLNNIGLCYADMNKPDLALKTYLESLELSIKVGDQQNEANTIGNIGEIHYSAENYDSALYYFSTAVALNEEINNVAGLAYNLERIGQCWNKKNQFSKGREYCLRALEMNKSLSLLKNEMQCHKCLYAAYKGLNNASNALLHFEKWEALYDTLLNKERIENILQSQYEFEYERKRIADSLEISNQQRIKEIELEADIDRKQNQQNILYGGIGILLIFGFFVYRSYRLKKRDNLIIAEQKEEVEHQKLVVEIKNQEITDSITYAKRIQDAILPPENLIFQHIPNCFIYYQPKDIVAGDFYWMEIVGDDIFFAVADCTGHGVPGAMVSVVCHNALNRSVREFNLKEPGKILDKTRELVIETFSKSEDSVKDGMDICLCTWNRGTKKLKYAGANNSLYIIREDSEMLSDIDPKFQTQMLHRTDQMKSLSLIEIKADKQPIGVYDKEQEFHTHEIQLKDTDKVYAFSDGFADQFGGEDGKKYKYKRFKTLLLDKCHLTMTEQKTDIASSFDEWKGRFDQLDDVCVFGMSLDSE